MALSKKQIKFCEIYAGNGGNGTQAATEAGYSKPAEQAYENLRKPHLVDFITNLTKDAQSKRIATAEERQEFWTSVMLGDNVDTDSEGESSPARMADRMKASELLGKSQGQFIERKEITGSGGENISINVVFDE